MRSEVFFRIVFLTFLSLTGCASAQERVCVREACFSVEVVHTEAQRAKGLMFRQGLEQGTGMFFIFDAEDIYPFWMKNTLFPIDIIWLDKDKCVVHIASDVPPCRTTPCPVYTPLAKALYVLEIPAGDALRYGIKPGDILR